MLRFMARRVSSEQAEGALAFAASTVESSDDAIVGMTLYGMITGWNSGTERFCGYTTREVFGRWPIGITITEDELAKILKRVGRGERVNHYENIEVKKSGQRINVSVTVVADPEHRRKGRRGIFDRPRHDAPQAGRGGDMRAGCPAVCREPGLPGCTRAPGAASMTGDRR
jgi:PAS domain S-box-containing protein